MKFILLFYIKIVLISLLFMCCSENEARDYDYIYLNGTTGITNCIQVGSKTIQIKFHPKSKTAESFRALRWNILLANSDTGITLYGRLLPTVYKTPAGPGLPDPEDYQLFILENWYVNAPFSVMSLTDNNPFAEINISERSEFTGSDFDEFPGKGNYDFNQHIRRQK